MSDDDKPQTPPIDLRGRVLNILPTGYVSFYTSDMQIGSGYLHVTDQGQVSVKNIVLPDRHLNQGGTDD